MEGLEGNDEVRKMIHQFEGKPRKYVMAVSMSPRPYVSCNRTV